MKTQRKFSKTTKSSDYQLKTAVLDLNFVTSTVVVTDTVVNRRWSKVWVSRTGTVWIWRKEVRQL